MLSPVMWRKGKTHEHSIQTSHIMWGSLRLTQIIHANVHVHVYSIIHLYKCLHVYVFIHTILYIQTYIHTYIHTQVQLSIKSIIIWHSHLYLAYTCTYMLQVVLTEKHVHIGSSYGQTVVQYSILLSTRSLTLYSPFHNHGKILNQQPTKNCYHITWRTKSTLLCPC